MAFDRPYVRSKYLVFFTDEEHYASFSANIDKATSCWLNNNIEEHYDREGWKMLLLHYIQLLDLGLSKFNIAKDIVPKDLFRECKIIQKTTYVKWENYVITHEMIIKSDTEILSYTIKVAKMLQVLMRANFKLSQKKIDRWTKLMLKKDNIGQLHKNRDKLMTRWQR